MIKNDVVLFILKQVAVADTKWKSNLIWGCPRAIMEEAKRFLKIKSNGNKIVYKGVTFWFVDDLVKLLGQHFDVGLIYPCSKIAQAMIKTRTGKVVEARC